MSDFIPVKERAVRPVLLAMILAAEAMPVGQIPGLASAIASARAAETAERSPDTGESLIVALERLADFLRPLDGSLASVVAESRDFIGNLRDLEAKGEILDARQRWQEPDGPGYRLITHLEGQYVYFRRPDMGLDEPDRKCLAPHFREWIAVLKATLAPREAHA